ncbi:uncharacterized protein LOC123444701 [Hordeum vulgare subsp. vulgare]|uniref:uncharacterized protein LOC123444701 n=1 Tax=Hordeum vulgare subsp. vulgare TaxID=112509 RepID=UPI001D1A4FE3|nr:uncharacterized protein LOC123444701 [Hordeum vulgare subsp. vulgare]XP_044977448.1 uncharacterized protein LOC123444701 [Hordeum vulgare subsp. vulgare]
MVKERTGQRVRPYVRGTILAFPTLDSLTAYLRPRLPGPALASWGSAPGTKNLLNLFLELSCGDCTLLPAASSPPALVMRAVHVATVRIRNRRGALLLETRQLLSDGTLRQRAARPLSEKLRPGVMRRATVAAGAAVTSDFSKNQGDNVDSIDQGGVEGLQVGDWGVAIEDPTESGNAAWAQSTAQMDPQVPE